MLILSPSVLRMIRPLCGLIFGGLALTSCLPAVRAAEFCALDVRVTDLDGKPITSTWIELVDPTDRVVRREMVGHEFKICDFGFGPHTLRVGTNECLPVAISNLRVVMGHPLFLNVVLNGCSYREVMRNACLAYFRTVDGDHKPLPEVDFSPRLTLDQRAQTDSLGRWQGLFTGAYSLTFTKSGYASADARIQCRADEEVDVEVVLKRQAASDPKNR